MPAQPPKRPDQRRRRNVPVRGEWRPAPGVGWQHGAIPPPPDGLLEASRTAWTTWFRAWFAAHWTADDLPGLRVLVRTYDQVERGEFQRGPELRLLMDTYGISPKGQQDRRWEPPSTETPVARTQPTPVTRATPYSHLREVV